MLVQLAALYINCFRFIKVLIRYDIINRKFYDHSWYSLIKNMTKIISQQINAMNYLKRKLKSKFQ